MVRRHHGAWRIAAAGHVHRERGRDLGRAAGRGATWHRLLRGRRRSRTAAGILERGAMSGSPLASSPLAVQRGILGAVLLVVCWEGLARGSALPSYVLSPGCEIL